MLMFAAISQSLNDRQFSYDLRSHSTIPLDTIRYCSLILKKVLNVTVEAGVIFHVYKVGKTRTICR